MTNEYWEAMVAKKHQQSKINFTTTSASSAAFASSTHLKSPGTYHIINQNERDLFDWINMIVNVGWPVNCVESTFYRDFHRGKSKFSIKTVRVVILAMTIQVEEILAAEMREASMGSIVHDAWSKFGMHFFALFATYKTTREVVDEEGAVRLVTGPVISLLSVAPLHTPVRETVDSDGFLPTAEEAEVESKESTNFTAKAHFDHICDTLQLLRNQSSCMAYKPDS